MIKLGNSRGGISPKAMRALYTGAVRTIFTWGAELWNGPYTRSNISTMQRIEYMAIRKITGAYYGSSMEKLGLITNVEPLQIKLNDMSASWAARSPRNTQSWHIG